MEGCARARLARSGDEGRNLLMDGTGEEGVGRFVGRREKSDKKPPSYEISEKERKNKRGIFGRKIKIDERNLR